VLINSSGGNEMSFEKSRIFSYEKFRLFSVTIPVGVSVFFLLSIYEVIEGKYLNGAFIFAIFFIPSMASLIFSVITMSDINITSERISRSFYGWFWIEIFWRDVFVVKSCRYIQSNGEKSNRIIHIISLNKKKAFWLPGKIMFSDDMIGSNMFFELINNCILENNIKVEKCEDGLCSLIDKL
jgi:hypothetical protein